MPPAEKVQMQMKNGLPTILSSVDHRPVSGRRNSLLPRERRRKHGHSAEQLAVSDVVERADVLSRHDHDVDGRLRRDVAKREIVRGIGHHLGGDLSPHDPAEDAFVSHSSSWFGKVG